MSAQLSMVTLHVLCSLPQVASNSESNTQTVALLVEHWFAWRLMSSLDHNADSRHPMSDAVVCNLVCQALSITENIHMQSNC